MKLSIILKWLISVFNPPYQLTLSETIQSKEPNKTIYIFKQYGSHEFIKLTFKDIKNNNSLLQSINPKNLMKINLSEFLLSREYEKYYVTEEIRNNSYKIKNNSEEIVCSGEYIHKNIEMFQTINSSDLYKIMYYTGFKKGRSMSSSAYSVKKINSREVLQNKNNSDNVIPFNRKNKLTI